MQAMPAPEYIDKAEVAKRLKISERTVLTLVGKIKCEKRRSEDSNQVGWMFHAGDVERYAFERDNPNFGGLPAKQASQPALPAPDTAEEEEPAASVRPANFNPHCWPKMLTVDQAAEYFNVTKSFLREELVRYEKALEAESMGRVQSDPKSLFLFVYMGRGSHGGSWRIDRDSLAY